MTGRALRCLALLAAAVPAAAQETVVSTRQDTKELSLTVYNQGFAVVREQRDLDLRAGRTRVRYEDVAQQIQPATVSLASTGPAGGVSVREQNYQYDLVSPAAIMDKSIGRNVRFRRRLSNGGVETLEGTLVSSFASGGVVIRTADGRLILSPEGEVEVTQLPEGLISRPSLLWLLDSERAGRQRAEVSYMTDGIGWSADYVAVADSSERRVDLTGWVTLDNKSGATFRDAQLQLMAGAVRRVQPQGMALQGVNVRIRGAATAAPPAFSQEAFFEYHLYTLDGRTTLADKETKQMALTSAHDVGVNRRLVFDSRRGWGWGGGPGQGSSTTPVKAAIMLEMQNTRANGMGMPLPAGVVRLYKADSRGNLQFLGEDRIEHTPRDETVRLYVGDAFDVVATRRIVSERNSERSSETTVELTIRNHKETAADVAVVEHFWGTWRMLSTTHPANRVDATTAEFPLRVPADSTVTLTYTVRVTW
jgi:hypothetical protein